MTTIPQGIWLLATTLSVGIALVPPALASQLVDRNASGVVLQVDGKGRAMLSYRAGNRARHVLVWGAINARPASPNAQQVRFRVDYSGGWGTYHVALWRNFGNLCRAYDGPALPYFVTGCKAPDGSYWAVQSWQVPLPDLGFTPWQPAQAAYELHVSHWSGPPVALEVWTDWVYSGRYQEVFGRLTYGGTPVYGFKTTRYGAPLEGFGRLIYLDTLDSAYGAGWRRENSFVPHKGTGIFCYGFFPHDPSSGGYAKPPSWASHKLRGPGVGKQYRLSVAGPGVTPDVSVTVPGLHDYDRRNASDVQYEQQQNAKLDELAANDRLCHHH